MNPAVARRILALAILIVTILATGLLPLWLTGCAADEGWRYTHTPLRAVYVTVDGDQLQRVCRSVAGYRQNFTYHGCAALDYTTNECRIYTEADPPAWLREHEEMHCKGFSH